MLLQPLKILQVNVQRSSLRVQALLNSGQYDIIMMQEPWWGEIGVGRSDIDPLGNEIMGVTSGSGVWECFTPSGNSRLHVATWVRKGADHLHAVARLDIIDHPDILLLECTYGKTKFRITNFYNHTVQNAVGPGIHKLLEFDDLDITIPHLIGGDFNAQHPDWNLESAPNNALVDQAGIKIADFMEIQNFELLTPNYMPTHFTNIANHHNSIIDLTWTNVGSAHEDFFMEYKNLGQSGSLWSDHAAIHLEINPNEESGTMPLGEATYVVDPAELAPFTVALLEFFRRNPFPAAYPSKLVCKETARLIHRGVEAALAASMKKRRRRHKVVAPWWNAECGAAATVLRNATADSKDNAKKSLHALT